MTRSPTTPGASAPVLLATGTIAGRTYLLAVGLHALGIWLPADETGPDVDPAARDEFATVVHQPPRTAAELRGVVDVALALRFGFYRRRYVLGL